MVQEFTGVPIDPETLGGAAKHAQMSGLASFVVPDLDSASEVVEELLPCSQIAPRLPHQLIPQQTRPIGC